MSFTRARWLELILVFVVGPLVISLAVLPLGTRLLFPSIWALAVVCLALERWHPDPPRETAEPPERATEDQRATGAEKPTGADAARTWDLPRIFLLFGMSAALLALALWIYEPSRLLSLPRRRPELMAIIAVFYPLMSVYPQEFAFRIYFFRRYERLLGSGWPMLFTSAILFAWAHIVMLNALSIALSLVGGLFFAITYRRTRWIGPVWLEHSLYGVFLFFIGWGSFFFAGSRVIPA